MFFMQGISKLTLKSCKLKLVAFSIPKLYILICNKRYIAHRQCIAKDMKLRNNQVKYFNILRLNLCKGEQLQ